METQSIGAENAPGRGDVKLQLEAPEIPTGEPILPPPLDYNRLPLARLVHIDEAIGPVTSSRGAEYCGCWYWRRNDASAGGDGFFYF